MNRHAELAAVSLFDGSLKIVKTENGRVKNNIQDEEMSTPITSLAWKRVRDANIKKQ